MIEPKLLGVKGHAGIVCAASLLGLRAREVFGINGIDQINFAAQEAQHLGVAILLNVETDGIEIRQGASLLVVLPVVWIAVQLQIGSGFVVSDVERSQDRHFFFLRLRGENRDLIELAIEARDWSRERHRNLVKTGGLRQQLAFAGPKGVARRRVQRRVH